MSDISIRLSWLDGLLLLVLMGWPGMVLGGVAGWAVLRKRRVLGAAVGALFGGFAVTLLRLAA